MKMGLKIILVAFIALIVASASMVTTVNKNEQSKSPQWKNYDIIDEAYPYDNPSYVDNFFAGILNDIFDTGASNKDDAMAQINSHSKWTNAGSIISNNISAVYQHLNPSDPIHQLVDRYYNQALNPDLRNAVNINPYVVEIRGIEYVTDLGTYLRNNSAGIDPFVAVTVGVNDDASNSPMVITMPYPAMFANNELTPQSQIYMQYFQEAMAKEGFIDADIERYSNAVMDLGRELSAASTMNPEVKTYNELLGNTKYPILDQAYAMHVQAETRGIASMDNYIFNDPGYFKALNDYCTDDHIDAYVGALLFYLFERAGTHSTMDYLDLYNAYYSQISGQVLTIENIYNQDFNAMFDRVFWKAYVDYYDPDGSSKKELVDFMNSLKEETKEFYSEIEWISDYTKNAIMEKLDNLAIRACYPDSWTDYNFTDYMTMSDDFFDLYAGLNQWSNSKLIKESGQKANEMWPASIDAMQCNAYYMPTDNSVNLCLGFTDVFYSENMSFEQILAVFGVSIGHEYTHGFDNSGSQYGKSGEKIDWFAPEDKVKYNDRVEKLKNYLTGIHMTEEQTHREDMIGEVMADFGGMSIALHMASKVPDFDYGSFFRAYAEMWIQEKTPEQYEVHFSDVHPSGMFRVNMTVQQFDIFQKYYDVKKGDGMYLAEKDRVLVW